MMSSLSLQRAHFDTKVYIFLVFHTSVTEMKRALTLHRNSVWRPFLNTGGPARLTQRSSRHTIRENTCGEIPDFVASPTVVENPFSAALAG